MEFPHAVALATGSSHSEFVLLLEAFSKVEKPNEMAQWNMFTYPVNIGIRGSPQAEQHLKMEIVFVSSYYTKPSTLLSQVASLS